MMISPNIYYETTMKGKSREDHLEEIRRVEADVRELEEIISRPGYMPSMFPDERTVLEWNREYLAILKKESGNEEVQDR
ncbi:MAG: hypothetical protein IKE16_05560 [Solobacterium sp.]|nr:hypothetical protein [Solobacterium sp.]